MIEEFRSTAMAAFHGLPVFEFTFGTADDAASAGVPEDVEAWAWRVGATRWDGVPGKESFPLFLATVDTTRVKALLLSGWYVDQAGLGLDTFPQALLDAADRFPALEALFTPDLPRELAEISWIEMPDPRDLLAAFPALKVFGTRGRPESVVEPFEHAGLEELVVQSGGLAPETVNAVGRSAFPELTSLELYLGESDRGGGASPEDLAPILDGTPFPKLRHLGLRDAENTDDIAAVLASAPVVAGLETLDLSLGTLGDEGAAALLAGQPLTHLRKLDLHHHYMSEAMVQRLREALPTTEIDAGDPCEEVPFNPGYPDYLKTFGPERSYRYVAVSE